MAAVTVLPTQPHNADMRKSVLTISLSKHLTGHPISEVITQDWTKAGDRAQDFDNVGFDLDAGHFDDAIQDLRRTLHGRHWDGVLVGWCLRGYPERTAMFERVTATCVDAARADPNLKIVFCTGPDNLAEATLRNFP